MRALSDALPWKRWASGMEGSEWFLRVGKDCVLAFTGVSSYCFKVPGMEIGDISDLAVLREEEG